MSGVVGRACSILQEEFATGTLSTSRQLRPPLVERPNSGLTPYAPERYSERDARQLLDRIFDALQHNQAGTRDQLDALSLNRSSGDAGDAGTDVRLPVYTAARVARPGETVEITLAVENEDRVSPSVVHLTSTDLIAGNGNRIPLSQIDLAPEKSQIPPAGRINVTIRVTVPAEANSGDYKGLLHASSLNSALAIIRIRVD